MLDSAVLEGYYILASLLGPFSGVGTPQMWMQALHRQTEVLFLELHSLSEGLFLEVHSLIVVLLLVHHSLFEEMSVVPHNLFGELSGGPHSLFGEPHSLFEGLSSGV